MPRFIRDYIFGFLSSEEKVEIYKNVCNIYLGNNWRNSIKLVQSKGAELDLIVHQNLQIAIRFILLNGVESKNEIETSRMTRVLINLIDYFQDKRAYKEAAFLSEETFLLIKDVDFTDLESSCTQLMKKLGENLRMTSVHERAISILKSICDDEDNSLSKDDRNDIRLSLAYAFKTKNNKEEAVKYANLVKQNEKEKDCSTYLSADAILVHFINNENERFKKLNALKNKAEKLGFNTLKANLILEINNGSTDANQIKQIDKIILTSKGDAYTKVRALLAKAKIVLKSKNIDEITDEDLLGLNISYSYSFYQRLHVLLTKCHLLAWEYWDKQNQYDQLLNLFRYSSFVWRLCGEVELEKKYLDELQQNVEFLDWFRFNKNNINGSYYEQRILALFNMKELEIN